LTRNVATILQFLCHIQQIFAYMGSKSCMLIAIYKPWIFAHLLLK
jgi:hypothetical protein